MSEKQIIVEISECNECPFVNDEYDYCQVAKFELDIYIGLSSFGLPENCPLKKNDITLKFKDNRK